MKASPETVAMIRDNIKIYLEKRGFNSILESLRKPESNPSVAELWTIWHHVIDEKRSSDDAPRFKDRARVLSYDWHFSMYPDGTDDNTLTTALRAAIKGLQK